MIRKARFTIIIGLIIIFIALLIYTRLSVTYNVGKEKLDEFDIIKLIETDSIKRAPDGSLESKNQKIIDKFCPT